MGFTFIRKKAKFIAYLLLLNIVFSLAQPISAYALTSGPSQPESQSFQPVGVSDMVDLASGDFKYNVPLMDVDGYPLNLSYASGVGMEDEASWVGLGWNLNVGSISRQLRGVPDDFMGDTVATTHYTKPKITVGGRLTAKVEVFGKARVNGSFSFGIFSDNYNGIGAELGVNAGMSYSFANSGLLTSSMGIGVLSNTSSGVDVTPNIAMSIAEHAKTEGTVRASLSSSLGYNSRSGLKSLTLSQSFAGYQPSLSLVSYNTEPITPKIQIPYFSEYGSFSFDVGGVVWGVYGSAGGTGYRSERHELRNVNYNQQYGFLYAEQGKDKTSAVQDFIREKENPIINELPNLAIPVHTPDIFSYNSQMGSGQFRLYRGGTGMLYDNEVSDLSEVQTFGADIGFGQWAHGGVTLFEQSTVSTTRKWTGDNAYLKYGDFQSPSREKPFYEHVYFKNVGERSVEDTILRKKLFGTSTLAIAINGKKANSAFVSNTSSSQSTVDTAIVKKERARRSTSISYLTAKEAKQAGLDKEIKTYSFLDSATFNPNSAESGQVITSRTNGKKKEHHISEITVTAAGGERTVYGIPVYNTVQEEYSFALGNKAKKQEYSMVKNNLVSLNPGAGTIDYKKGIDHYFHKERQAAYASSFLITGILSPDYVDKTGDGITDDDLGKAMKFSYAKIDEYKWRSPYASRNESDGSLTRTATLNRGLLADPDDDKGSIIYGEKELYYIQTIESRTQIAYFITTDRLDGLGVVDWQGDRNTAKRQKALKEIRLYSKADLTKPIKTVKFLYNYELCKGTPNSIGTRNGAIDEAGINNGKLTLKKVWFEYGNSPKGKEHPYAFTYNNADGDVKYNTMYTDRWGVYKDPINNPSGLTNEEYPYSVQNKPLADQNVALYHLKKIDLPTGGIINVEYESDDYAYVQNKRAAVMKNVGQLLDEGGNPKGNLIDVRGIRIQLDAQPPSFNNEEERLAWFKQNYLSGSDYMFSRFYVKIGTDDKLSDGLNWDFISTYCKVKKVVFSGATADVFFDTVKEAGVEENPIRFSAWQKMKNEYPRYAYPGFLNRVGDGKSTAKAAVTAVVNAAKNLTELKQNFYVKAQGREFAKEVDVNRSFVRISKLSGNKIGGGVRVRKINIDDNWKAFTNESTNLNGVYGQSYDYTTIEDGKPISSGVASYEPSIGNEENPFKQPVPYIQKIKGAINNYFELEEPFGESFFPAATVAYSKVTVKDLGAGGVEDARPQTGSIVNEFYTARDFPVRVKVLPIQKYDPKPDNNYSMLKTNSYQEMTLSQGYSIELNDMHGKSKATRVLNQAGAEISSTVYHYAVENEDAKELRLDNKVDIVGPSGKLIKDVYLGRDIEFFTDFREQESKNTGKAINIGVDVIPGIFGIPFPIPHWPVNGNNEYKLFRSACAVKVIQSNGIVKKVVKTENGSSISVENVAYDGLTGEAVVTKTQNEFNKNLYTTNFPAYWAYPKMGGEYQNIGMLLSDVTLNSYAEINAPFDVVLKEGDEIIDVTNQAKYWVIASSRLSTAHNLINVEGKLIKTLPGKNLLKILRSAFRNVLNANVGSITSLNNPIVNNQLQPVSNLNISESLKALSASVTLYKDEWPMDGNGQVNKRFENTSTSKVFRYSRAGVHQFHGDSSCRAYTPCQTGFSDEGEFPCNFYTYFSNSVLNKRMDQIGIWLDAPIPDTYGEAVGVLSSFEAPESGYYFIGFAGDDRLKITIDNGAIVIPNAYNSIHYWQIHPIYLYKGLHSIELEGFNEIQATNTLIANPGSIAVEIYNHTLAQLQSITNAANLNTIFRTSSLLVNPGIAEMQTFRTINGVKTWRFTYESYYNPFVHGVRGNWRPFEQKVFQSARTYDHIFDQGKRGVNVSDAGYINAFKPYWNYSAVKGMLTESTNPQGWITANTITLYDKYGKEIENMDALGRYSAAKFDFLGEFPSAVASNAMNREIYVNSFEDNWQMAAYPGNDILREFIHNGNYTLRSHYNSDEAHTGNYSVELPTIGVTLSTIVHNGEYKKGVQYLERNAVGEYSLISSAGLSPKGFEPKPSEKYIFNAWVKDGQALTRDVKISLSQKEGSSSSTPVSLKCKAIVEGWKLIEGVISLSEKTGALELKLTADYSGIFIDDIRIHPYKAHLKSYAFGATNFKLMAELDENAFATFYEYDDQGSLIRVKKETERGIITIKENRSSYRKKI